LIKTAIVSHTYPTKLKSGQANFIKQEAHLVSQIADVELHIPAVYALPFQKQYNRSLQIDEKDIPYHRFHYLSFPAKRLPSVTKQSLSHRLLKSLRKQNPDLVHIHWLYPSGLSAPTLKKAGYPVVLTIHGGDWYSIESNQKLMTLISKSLLDCNKIICVGGQLLEIIANFYPNLREKLIHIPHGIDTDQFYPIPDKKKIEQDLKWNTDKKNLLCVANLYHGKGIDLLIKAFSKMSEREKYHLHIVSPASEREAKIHIDQLVKMHNLDQEITFYDSMRQKQLVDFFRGSDVLISPSRKEGFGLVVAEAIACGTPVLATRSGGPEEIVNPDCGILVDADSADSLSTGLESILKNLHRFHPDKMHHYIKTNFSIPAKKEKLLAVYHDIIS